MLDNSMVIRLCQVGIRIDINKIIVYKLGCSIQIYSKLMVINKNYN